MPLARRWTEAEDKILIENAPHKTARELRKMIPGVSHDQVSLRCEKLGVKPKNCYHRWTQEEDKILIENAPHKTAGELIEMLGNSVNHKQLKYRCNYLKISIKPRLKRWTEEEKKIALEGSIEEATQKLGRSAYTINRLRSKKTEQPIPLKRFGELLEMFPELTIGQARMAASLWRQHPRSAFKYCQVIYQWKSDNLPMSASGGVQ